MSNEKEVFKQKLLRTYEPASPEERIVDIAVWNRLFETYSYICVKHTEKIWNLFVKQPVKDLKEPFGFDIPGTMLPVRKNHLMQGHHPIVRYEYHNVKKGILRYNPIEMRCIITRKGNEQYHYLTDEQHKEAKINDAKAFLTAYENWRYMCIYLLFLTPDDFKKLTCSEGTGTTGINAELIALYESKDSRENFNHNIQGGQSLEQKIYKFKDGLPQPFETTDSSAKYWEDKEHLQFENLKKMQKILAANVWEYEKTNVAEFANMSDEISEYIGYLDKISDVYSKMCHTLGEKYNVGYVADSSDQNKREKVIEEMVSINKNGLYIANSPNYKNITENNDKYLDSNPLMSDPKDLILFIHHEDYRFFKTILPLLPNTSITSLSQYTGIPESNIIQFDGAKKGEARIWHRGVLGIHPVGEIKGDTETHKQWEFTNIWIDLKLNKVIWPFPAIMFKKKSS